MKKHHPKIEIEFLGPIIFAVFAATIAVGFTSVQSKTKIEPSIYAAEIENEISITHLEPKTEIEFHLIHPEMEFEIQTSEPLPPAYVGGRCSKDIDIEVQTTEPYFRITDADRITLHNIVAGEAIGESYKEKKLVAQCLLTAMMKTGLNAEQVRYKYAYAGWMPEAKTKYPKAWDDVVKAVSEVFDDGNLPILDSVEYFYSTRYTYSKWHESLRFVIQEGSTRFFSVDEKIS